MTYDSLWGVGNDGYIRSEVAVLEEGNAYNLAMNNESVLPSNWNIRYGAFPERCCKKLYQHINKNKLKKYHQNLIQNP